MTREQVAEAAGAARERLKSGRRNQYKSYSVAEERAAWLEGRELERVSIYAPEYRDAGNFAEWLDDIVIMWGNMRGYLEQPLLVTLAEAAREDLPAAVRALRAARDLPPAVQWSVFQNLRLWGRQDERGIAHGDRLSAALLAEWSRLKLPETDPAEQPAPRRRRRWETMTEATA